MDQSTIDAVMKDWETAPVSDKLKAALHLIETQTLRPRGLTEGFIDDLETRGLDRKSIESVANTGFHFNFINRVADAYGFPAPNAKQQKRQAKFLEFVGKSGASSGRSDQSWTVGKDKRIRPNELEEARQQLFTTKGVTDPLFRRSIEYFAAEKWGGVRSEHRVNIPHELIEFLEMLSLSAFRITDGQVDHLKSLGYTDREFYEIIFSAALGAAMPGVENIFSILYGSEVEGSERSS